MRKKRIMIVDDSRVMRLIIQNLLTQGDAYDVVAQCGDGLEALRILPEVQPDIILVDVEMPVMDGLTFIRHARLRTRAQIVVLSSVVEVASPKALEARRLGADAAIQKPSGALSVDLAEHTGPRILETLRRISP
jgi:two-component system chemotaxis response regulator CheB